MIFIQFIIVSLILFLTEGQEICTVGASCSGSENVTHKRCCISDYYASTVITCSPTDTNHFINSSDRCPFGCFAGECISSSLCHTSHICNFTNPSTSNDNQVEYDFPSNSSFCCGNTILNTCNETTKNLTSSTTCHFGCSQKSLKCFTESEPGAFCYSIQENVTNPPEFSTKCSKTGQSIIHCEVKNNVSRVVNADSCTFNCNEKVDPQRCFYEHEVGSKCPLSTEYEYCVEKVLKFCKEGIIEKEEQCEHSCEKIPNSSTNKTTNPDFYECSDNALELWEYIMYSGIGIVVVCCCFPCVILCIVLIGLWMGNVPMIICIFLMVGMDSCVVMIKKVNTVCWRKIAEIWNKCVSSHSKKIPLNELENPKNQVETGFELFGKESSESDLTESSSVVSSSNSSSTTDDDETEEDETESD